MNRRGKIFWKSGQPVEGEMFWVRNGERYPCELDEFGNFSVFFPDSWVNEIQINGQTVHRDWDIGDREEFDGVYLKVDPPQKAREGRLLQESGEPLSGVPIELHYRGDVWRSQTDSSGVFSVEYPHTWIDQVLVDGDVVHEDWDVSSRELGELRVSRAPGSKREMTLRYYDGSAVENEEVIWVYRGEQYQTRTRSDGSFQIEYPHDWVDSMMVAGLEVRTDWDLEGKEVLEEFSLPNPATQQAEGRLLGISGMIFWSDGTALDKTLEVRWADPNGYTWSSENGGGYCRDDGTFLVPLGEAREKEALTGGRWFVGGHEPRFSKRVGASRFFHVLPDSAGGGGSSTGGLVTGFTVDRDGDPIDGVRVHGEVRSNSFLGFLNTTEDVEVRSDRRGGFALGFRGGGALKTIYLNGHRPSRVYIKDAAGEEIDFPLGGGIPAGSFSLYFVLPR